MRHSSSTAQSKIWETCINTNLNVQPFVLKYFMYIFISKGLNKWCNIKLHHCIHMQLKKPVSINAVSDYSFPNDHWSETISSCSTPPFSLSRCWTSALIHLFNCTERHLVSLNQEKGFKCKFPFMIKSWKCQRPCNYRLQELLRYFSLKF